MVEKEKEKKEKKEEEERRRGGGGVVIEISAAAFFLSRSLSVFSAPSPTSLTHRKSATMEIGCRHGIIARALPCRRHLAAASSKRLFPSLFPLLLPHPGGCCCCTAMTTTRWLAPILCVHLRTKGDERTDETTTSATDGRLHRAPGGRMGGDGRPAAVSSQSQEDMKPTVRGV